MSIRLIKQQGFTLIEMIIVITITGVIAGMVAMFIRAPVQGYVDSSRRAELTDVADTALRRMSREIRAAVPNSVRPAPAAATTYIEFLPTRTGGRYRADAGTGTLCGAVAGNTDGDALSFTAADTCFEIIGPPITFTANDAVIVGSTQFDGNPPYQDVASATGVRRMVPAAGAGVQQIVRLTSATSLPASSELSSRRFQVVDAAQQAVTYACIGALGVDANGDGTGVLQRYWGYGFNPVQPADPATLGGSSAILANNVSACRMDYDAVNANFGLLAVTLTITRGGESVSLYNEIHVNNIP